MAHLEVWKGNKLVTRREVDERTAAKGLRVRLGSKGRAHIRLGESKTIGSYRVELAADLPADPAGGEVLTELEFSEPGNEAASPAAQPVPQVEGYTILDELGHGGMGIVWRAVQLSTKRQVALKLLGTRSFVSDKGRARFSREVALAAKLTHPHIARVYDSGLHSGAYFYAMELVEGMHLDRYVREMELDVRQCLLLMQKVCAAMAYAHSQGIVHRDLKPSNILVTGDGEPHILDFGLAKDRETTAGDLTISIEGEIMGTPGYMSPEQAAGKTDLIDERSDVYSLGVILYQLLTAQMPQDPSGSPYEMMKRRVEEEVIPPRQAAAYIDADLEHLLLKALTREPAERYRSVSDLAKDIERYLAGEPLSARGPDVIYVLRRFFRKHPQYARAIAAAVILTVMVVIIQKAVWRWFVNNTNVAVEYRTYDERVLEGKAYDAYRRLKSTFMAERWLAAESELHVLDTTYKDTRVVAQNWREIDQIRKRLALHRGNGGSLPDRGSVPTGRE